MYILGALVFALLTAWAARRGNEKDRPGYDRLRDEDEKRVLLLHIRQDLKVICFLLFAILIMLGVIAEVQSHR